MGRSLLRQVLPRVAYRNLVAAMLERETLACKAHLNDREMSLAVAMFKIGSGWLTPGGANTQSAGSLMQDFRTR
jgi:hypothetical protein